MSVLTPHDYRTIRNVAGDWRPFAEADRLSDLLKSPLAIEARRLYDETVAQEVRIAQIEREARDTERRIAETNAALARAIRKNADDGADGSEVRMATAERDAVIGGALDPVVWRSRLDAARERLVLTQAALRQHLDTHALALVDELRQEAERVAKRWQAAHVKARALLSPIEAEHTEITATLLTLLGRTEPFEPADIPSQRFNELPFPTAESLAAHRALTGPTPEPDPTA